MFFIGQKHIMTQLKDLLPEIYEKGLGVNMLMRGPSGWGKTRMSFGVCNYLSGGDFDYCLGDKLVFNENRRVHFIDEVHLLKDPEILYPKMDSGKHVIVIATNDVALLPEALSNRCIEFIFDRYTKTDLRDITTSYLVARLPVDFLDYIIESAGGNPRIIKSLAMRLDIVISRHPEVIKNIDINEFKYLLKNTFGIQDGMDVMCVRYVDALEKLGGTAALSTLSAYLHIDQNTLKFYVEPILLYKNRVKISSKGRSLI